MDYPNFTGGSYVSQSPIADQERTVNWYVEEIETTGKRALYPTPGVEAITLTYPTLANPSAPTVTNEGTAGATTYGYKIVAFLGDAVIHTAASSEGTTATGNAALDSTNFNRLTWPAISGATTYTVYRTTGGASPPVLLTSGLTVATYDDTGSAGTSATPESTNTTGTTASLAGPGKAQSEAAGRCFVVSGTIFGEVTASNIFTPWGVVGSDTNPATISYNGDGGGELFITAGGNGYIFDLDTNALTQIAALTGIATMGDQIDGYFLSLNAANGQATFSGLLDGLTWDPTDFMEAGTGGPWIAMKVGIPYIYFWSDKVGEVWYDAGTFPIPFARTSSGLMQYGIAAPFSPEIVGGAVVWLGATANGDGVVLKASAFTPEVISTYPLRVAFDAYSTLSDAVGDTFDHAGHTFYLLTFPAASGSWAWDPAMALPAAWHEPLTWISAESRYIAWRPLFHAFVFGEHRMLDRSTGTYYRLASVGTDVESRPIRRLRRAPALVSENKRLFYPLFELYLEPGLGLSSGQGSDPQVMMRYSNDGGKTWSNEQTRSAGALGNYGTRVRWLRCGSGRKRVFEVSVTDAIPWRVMAAFIEVAGVAQKRAA